MTFTYLYFYKHIHRVQVAVIDTNTYIKNEQYISSLFTRS